VDIATTKINDPIIFNLIQVLYKKNNKKAMWEMDFFFKIHMWPNLCELNMF
jgi:hypothetical protein